MRDIPVVLSRFVATRGTTALYSGLAANLASSAPISAIYTASYEMVKETLLPVRGAPCRFPSLPRAATRPPLGMSLVKAGTTNGFPSILAWNNTRYHATPQHNQ